MYLLYKYVHVSMRVCVCVSECAFKMAAGHYEDNGAPPCGWGQRDVGGDLCVFVGARLEKVVVLHPKKDYEENNITIIHVQITYNQNITATQINLINITRNRINSLCLVEYNY